MSTRRRRQLQIDVDDDLLPSSGRRSCADWVHKNFFNEYNIPYILKTKICFSAVIRITDNFEGHLIRPWKRKPCFTGATDWDFPFWGIFFFSLPESWKISHFFGKSLKIGLRILENNWKYFPKIFLQKKGQIFGDFCVFRVIFATRMEKKMSRLTDPT